MGRVVRAALGLLMYVAALSISSRVVAATTPTHDKFVRVVGRDLVLNGKPFRFAGANVSVMHGPNERASYEALLDAVKADGLRVVRIWALGEIADPPKPHHPLFSFRIGKDGWVEESFEHLDRVLAAARARDLKVVVVLANRWKDYGGVASYLRWANQPVLRDVRGEPTAQTISDFYACAPCQGMYREHLMRIVGRTNSVTQLAYRDDPTILGWELINEASAVTARDEDRLLAWVKSSARFIKTIDPNHLVSAGHIGYATLRERDVWRRVQELPEVDFADVHAYPLSDRRVSSMGRLERWVDDRVALAHAIGKPLVFGEVGFEGGARGASTRARWLNAFAARAASRGASGMLVWIYEPAKNPRRSHSITEAGDDAGSQRVRRVLRKASLGFDRRADPRQATRWSRLQGAPVFAFAATQRAPQATHRAIERDGQRVIEIDPTQFARATFERTGVYREGPLEQVYGAGEGLVEYPFVAPGGAPRTLRVEARISSELPGSVPEADPRDGSDVEVSVDEEVIAIVRARTDDGAGELVRAELHDRRALTRLFATSRPHTLRFRALPSRYSGGLCIYGKATAKVLPEQRRPIETVRLTLEP
jgi:mannan endo-1,4-beta-mannosidase